MFLHFFIFFYFRLAVVTDEGALNLWIIPSDGLNFQVPTTQQSLNNLHKIIVNAGYLFYLSTLETFLRQKA
jgi:hypothetical protein